MTVGKLEIVPVRDAFAHEAHHFTVWLEQNIDALADRLNKQLTVLEREKSVGSFNVDLFCQDEDGHYIIVENQLDQTDHDHLGKLLTYLVNLEASTAIWVTPAIRPEHQRVIDWLNETTGADYGFYLVLVEAVRIADSPYAPLFTVLAAPDEQTREIGETKKELAGRQAELKAFWTELLERSKGKTHLFSTISPGHDDALGLGGGKTGITFYYVVAQNSARVEVYLDTVDTQKNKFAFDSLLEHKAEIERRFGAPLTWQRLDNRRASRISQSIDQHGGLKSPERWPDLQDAMIDTMIRFHSALSPFITNLNI